MIKKTRTNSSNTIDGQLLINFSGYNDSSMEFQVPERDDMAVTEC